MENLIVKNIVRTLVNSDGSDYGFELITIEWPVTAGRLVDLIRERHSRGWTLLEQRLFEAYFLAQRGEASRWINVTVEEFDPHPWDRDIWDQRRGYKATTPKEALDRYFD